VRSSGVWSTPYLLDAGSIVASSAGLETVQDLSGMTLGMLDSADIDEWSSQIPGLTEIVTVPHTDALVELLMSGQVDAVGVGSYLFHDQRLLEGPGLSVIFTDIAIQPLAIAFLLGDEDTRDLYDAALDQIRESGRWLARYEAEIGGTPPYGVQDMATTPRLEQ
jgi:ABC-type amino acid transport substrate-binding protein